MKFPLNATVFNNISRSYLLIFLFFYKDSKIIFEYFVFLLISCRISSPIFLLILFTFTINLTLPIEIYLYGNYSGKLSIILNFIFILFYLFTSYPGGITNIMHFLMIYLPFASTIVFVF